MKFKWQGVTLEGEINSLYVANGKRSLFMEITGKVPKKVQCTTRGHLWPIQGSIVIAESVVKDV